MSTSSLIPLVMRPVEYGQCIRDLCAQRHSCIVDTAIEAVVHLVCSLFNSICTCTSMNTSTSTSTIIWMRHARRPRWNGTWRVWDEFVLNCWHSQFTMPLFFRLSANGFVYFCSSLLPNHPCGHRNARALNSAASVCEEIAIAILHRVGGRLWFAKAIMVAFASSNLAYTSRLRGLCAEVPVASDSVSLHFRGIHLRFHMESADICLYTQSSSSSASKSYCTSFLAFPYSSSGAHWCALYWNAFALFVSFLSSWSCCVPAISPSNGGF